MKKFCWIRNAWEIQWIGLKVLKGKIIEQELMKSTRFLYLAVVIKYTFRIMDVMD